MKAKLCQLLPGFNGGLFAELNPDPTTNDFRQFKETRRVAPQDCQQCLCVQ